MLKRPVVLLPLTALVVGAGLFYLERRPAAEPTPARRHPVPSRDLVAKPWQPHAAAPKPAAGPATTATAPARHEAPPACAQQWLALAETDLDAAGARLGTEAAPLTGECAAAASQTLGQGSYPLMDPACAARPAGTALSQDCWLKIMLYRAAVITDLSQDESNDEASPAVLANRLVRLVLVDHVSSPEKVKEAYEVASTLAAKAPDVYEAERSKAFLTLLAEQTGQLPADEDRWRAEMATLRSFEGPGVAPEDPYMFSYLRASGLHDDARADAVTRELTSEHPESGLGPYFAANLQWSRGNREAALALLDQAIAKEPGNARYTATREKLAASPAGTKNLFTTPPLFQFGGSTL